MNSIVFKNDKQIFYNQIKGIIEELNDGDEFCSITLKIGHENSRNVNLTTKKDNFKTILENHKIGDKVCVIFYISSRKKHERWYTTATILDVNKES